MAEQSEMVGKHSSYYWQDNPSQIYHHITFWFHMKVQEFLSHVLKTSERNHDHKILLPREGCNWSALPSHSGWPVPQTFWRQLQQEQKYE